MATSRYLTQTITQRKKRLVPNARDQYGNDVYTTTTVQLTNCMIEPRLTFGTENTADEEHVGRGQDLFCADPEADIEPTDQFQYEGVWWEVDGPTNRYRGSFLGNDYCHVNLERITG